MNALSFLLYVLISATPNEAFREAFLDNCAPNGKRLSAADVEVLSGNDMGAAYSLLYSVCGYEDERLVPLIAQLYERTPDSMHYRAHALMKGPPEITALLILRDPVEEAARLLASYAERDCKSGWYTSQCSWGLFRATASAGFKFITRRGQIEVLSRILLSGSEAAICSILMPLTDSFTASTISPSVRTKLLPIVISLFRHESMAVQAQAVFAAGQLASSNDERLSIYKGFLDIPGRDEKVRRSVQAGLIEKKKVIR